MRKCVGMILLIAIPWIGVRAAPLTFNSSSTANVATTRDAWLAATGITDPDFLVDFESGFSDGQNISGQTGLFPGGLVITDSSGSGSALIEGTSGGIGNSDPVGLFSLEQNEQPYLELDFSVEPVEYVAFLDIDHTGTAGIVTFVGGGTANFSLETTASSGNTAEFFGIFRNDMPAITMIRLDASGDGTWGIDNVEYGVVIPAPAVGWLLVPALGMFRWVRRRPVIRP